MAGVHASARLPEKASPRNTARNAAASLRQHPRRTPPRDNKLLSSNKRQKLSHSPEPKQTAVVPLQQLKSQGSGSDQSANRWFDSVNEHVNQTAQASTEYDDEPPFFMSNQNNYLPNTIAPSDGSRLFGAPSRLDSENEELRGVIDDLTVENKRLKQIVRLNNKSNRNSPSTDGQDKLFEVRMHGLTSEKRRELEFLLKNFATSVHTSVPSVPNSSAGSGVSGHSHARHAGKAVTDSGYASNSNSGQPSQLPSHHSTRGILNMSQSARDKSITNYLHDIPDTLMPRQQPVVMSERARMALVVRRLEQLFTGKKAAPGEHSQPLQQQEVSQMAAHAEAKTSKKRKAEGAREAHILPPDTKANFDAVESGQEKKQKSDPKQSEGEVSASEGAAFNISCPGSPDQRPTRPLDLDIHRAQVAAENIQYIRHLGLSSPHLHTGDTESAWMYLNLLINMAQLHTVNVTPEFIRRSIKKVSTKFELSKDGHKVRWIGGPEGTVFSREEEKAIEGVDNNKDNNNSPDESNEDLGTGGSSKRSKTDTNSNAVNSNTTTSDAKTSGLRTSNTSKQQVSTAATSNQLSSLATKPTQSGSAFDYKPLVYRERSTDLAVEESYLQDTDSSLGSSSRDSSGLVHALSRSNLNRQRNSDEGLITFYNNPFFCSDYSGDKMPSNMLPSRDDGYVVGVHPGDDLEGRACRLACACYFTPNHGPTPFRPSKDEKLPELELVPLSAKLKDEITPMEFTVSGLGGIYPEDNFAIDIDVYMNKVSSNETLPIIAKVPFTGSEVRPKYKYECGSHNKIGLLPSRLPPPSYIFFTSSSSSGNQIEDDESTFDSDDSSSSADEDHPAPPTFMQHWSTEDSGEMAADEEDEHDDSSVDMLAVARAVDPARIAEQERQYIINQPGGRAVAGSLAATVGASRTSSSVGDIDSDVAEVVSEGEDDYDDDNDSNDSGMDVDY